MKHPDVEKNLIQVSPKELARECMFVVQKCMNLMGLMSEISI